MTLHDALIEILRYDRSAMQPATTAIRRLQTGSPSAEKYALHVIRASMEHPDIPETISAAMREIVPDAAIKATTIRIRMTENEANLAQLLADRHAGGNMSGLFRGYLSADWNGRVVRPTEG